MHFGNWAIVHQAEIMVIVMKILNKFRNYVDQSFCTKFGVLISSRKYTIASLKAVIMVNLFVLNFIWYLRQSIS